MTITLNAEPPSNIPGVTHTSTTYQIATDINFTNLVVNVNTTTELTTKSFVYNLNGGILYGRVKYFFSDNTDTGFFGYKVISENTQNVNYTPVRSPVLTKKPNKVNRSQTSIIINADPISIVGKTPAQALLLHVSTSWRVTDTAGVMLWERLNDIDNKNSIEIPESLLRSGKSIVVECIFNTDTDTSYPGAFFISDGIGSERVSVDETSVLYTTGSSVIRLNIVGSFTPVFNYQLKTYDGTPLTPIKQSITEVISIDPGELVEGNTYYLEIKFASGVEEYIKIPLVARKHTLVETLKSTVPNGHIISLESQYNIVGNDISINTEELDNNLIPFYLVASGKLFFYADHLNFEIGSSVTTVLNIPNPANGMYIRKVNADRLIVLHSTLGRVKAKVLFIDENDVVVKELFEYDVMSSLNVIGNLGFTQLDDSNIGISEIVAGKLVFHKLNIYSNTFTVVNTGLAITGTKCTCVNGIGTETIILTDTILYRYIELGNTLTLLEDLTLFMTGLTNISMVYNTNNSIEIIGKSSNTTIEMLRRTTNAIGLQTNTFTVPPFAKLSVIAKKNGNILLYTYSATLVKIHRVT